jgi:hypothetical protein
MAPELVVTPGGYRPSEMVFKIGADLRLRILTGRLQGVDASDSPVADYGSVPRDGGNPALSPGYALPPGEDTPEGSEPEPPLGHGWMSFAHWTNEGTEPISSFRATWTVPPEPVTRSGQTLFLFLAMQDSIPMTLLPALQWGASAAGGGDYWSVASWYIGGTTGAVFHGESVPVNVGDELTGFIRLANRQRAHCDYRCGFEGLAAADLPVFHVRELSRCGEIFAAYGVRKCTDFPDESAIGFRDIEIASGFRHPALAWKPVSAITDCGQHVVVLSDANPGGEVDVHFRPLLVVPAFEPVVEEALPEEVAAVPLIAAAVEAAPEEAAAEVAPEAIPAEAAPEVAAEVAPEEIEAAPLAAVAAEAEVIPEEAAAVLPAEAAPEAVAAEVEAAPAPAEVEAEAAPEVAAPEAAPEEEVAAAPLAAEAPEPVAAMATAAEPVAAAPAEAEAAPVRLQVAEAATAVPSLEVHPRIDRLVEITIHNHSPAGAGTGALEARVASLETTIAAFAQLLAAAGQPQRVAGVNGDVAGRLERLAQLKASGVLTDDEFAAIKAQVIGGRVSSAG